MTNDLSVNAKGSTSQAPAHGAVCCFQGTQLWTHPKDGFGTWQHLHI